MMICLLGKSVNNDPWSPEERTPDSSLPPQYRIKGDPGPKAQHRNGCEFLGGTLPPRLSMNVRGIRLPER